MFSVSYRVSFPVASFIREDNPRLTNRPLAFNGRLANHKFSSLVKETTGILDSGFGWCNHATSQCAKGLFLRKWLILYIFNDKSFSTEAN